MASDGAILSIARNLAKVLADYAYSRRPEDRKEIARLHAVLCEACGEQAQKPTDQVPAVPPEPV